ncbi:MAG: hypothetical protein WC670_17545 [Pseudolabrys sp.]|jgi:hypothetical protein
MVALTYSDARAATAAKSAAKSSVTAVPAAEAQAPRKSFFGRFLDAMMEARMHQAQREIRLYSRNLPLGHESQAGE